MTRPPLSQNHWVGGGNVAKVPIINQIDKFIPKKEKKRIRGGQKKP